MSKKHEIDDLNKLYTDGETADNTALAEMRGNVQMQAGEHYKKIQSKMIERLRESKTNESVKLRLTSNHIQVITKTYINGIISQAPGVKILPFNETELQDKKDAELSQSVWSDAEIKLEIEDKIQRWAESFVVIGEMASKIYWNPNMGKIIGYQQEVSESGQPVFESPMGDTLEPMDPMGNPHKPKASKIPVYQGQLCIDVLHPFNIIRKAGVESMAESPFLCVRQMMPIAEAKALLANIEDQAEREEKEKYIVESGKTTFKIFEAANGTYQDTKDQVMLREFYFRPCADYPNGYFYITTEAGILFEGELPFGLFPILIEGFDNLPTSPRATSIIRPLRAPQAEINRMTSAISTTQIVHGKDKIFSPMGSKVSKGTSFAGADEYSVSGNMPMVVEGKAGTQFEASLSRATAELYKLAHLEYEMAETSVQDPYQQLYKSLSQRKKYQIYVKKFERFLCKNAELYLKLAKRYLPDDYLVKAAGKREYINISEFRRIGDEDFNIRLKPMSNDIESLMGKQLNINTVLQYASKDLPPSAKGKILRAMPFLNEEEIFSDLTLDDENVESDILALDRGEFRPAQEIDKHDLYIERLNHRMKQSDFKLLNPQIQQMYQAKLQQHVELKAQEAMKIKEMQAEYWPTGGGLVKVDLYDANGKRMVMPQAALQHLAEVLEKQGLLQQQMQQLESNNQLQILQAASQSQLPPQDPQQPQGPMQSMPPQMAG